MTTYIRKLRKAGRTPGPEMQWHVLADFSTALCGLVFMAETEVRDTPPHRRHTICRVCRRRERARRAA